MSVVIDAEPAQDCAAEAVVAQTDNSPAALSTESKRSISAPRLAILLGVVTAVVLATLLGWFGFRVHQSQQALTQRSQFLQVARQGALNLTTIDYRHADADVHRILDSATGEFYNEFTKRSKPFIEVLQQAKATTVGTITEAGLESQTADTAQALVAVSVQTSNADEADPVPRVWRMRITVQRLGNQLKISDVGFVQ